MREREPRRKESAEETATRLQKELRSFAQNTEIRSPKYYAINDELYFLVAQSMLAEAEARLDIGPRTGAKIKNHRSTIQMLGRVVRRMNRKDASMRGYTSEYQELTRITGELKKAYRQTPITSAPDIDAKYKVAMDLFELRRDITNRGQTRRRNYGR